MDIDVTINNDRTMGGGAAATLLAGRYRVVKQLGQGGMGSVWLAEDTKLDGFKVAIKMLPSVLVNNKRAYAQVKAEALVSLKLSHPNIVTVRAFEEESGSPFLVMDYIDGRTLDDYLAEKGKLTEEETVKLLKPVAAALDYAHAQGVIHRDVKPGNVMIRKDGTPFVLDFGIAREIQETMTRVTGKLSSGTLMYMSPEQLHGAAPSAAQDVYSFAAMTYECLTGNPPFARGQIEYQIEHDVPAPLDPQFANCGPGVMAGLEKRPENRPRTCVGILVGKSNHGKLSSGEAPAKRFGGRAISIVFVLGVIGAFCGWFALRQDGIFDGGEQLGTNGSSACVLTNLLSQVELVTEMKMVPREALIDALGLQEGDDLNKIDLAARRKVVLSKIPNLRTLSIARERPDRVVIAAEERVPFVRLGVAGSSRLTGRVADSEGVVFARHKGTQSLPLVLKNESCRAEPGCRLSGRVSAALSLIKAWGETEFADIRILEVDTSKMDFLLVTLDNSSHIKVAWNGMDQGGASAEQDLRKRLGMLAKAMSSKVLADNVMWNLLYADRVYADTNDKTGASAEKRNESAVGEGKGFDKEISDLRAACMAAKKRAEDAEATVFAVKEMTTAVQLLADAERSVSRELPQMHPRNDQLVAKLLSKDVAPEGYKKFGNGYVRLENWDEISRRFGYAERLASFCAPDPRYILMLKDNGDDSYSPIYVVRPAGVCIIGEDLIFASESGRKRAYQNVLRAFEQARQVAMEASKPKVTLKAMLNGEEVNATVTSGLKDKTRKTPVTVDLSGWGIGSECEFELAYVRDGVPYKGKGDYTVKKGRHELNVKMSEVIMRKPGDEMTITLPGGAAMVLCWCPPGTFTMGSPLDEKGRENDETQHLVTLTKGFWLGKYEVTQRQWESVMGTNPSMFKSPDRPVEQVSWEDAQAFIRAIRNATPDLDARLPTEAEWEYACRAGTMTALPNGRDLLVYGCYNGPALDDIAWYGGNSGVGFELANGVDYSNVPEKQYACQVAGSHPVGRKAANAWGLHDMIGNVLEWCSDWYDADYYHDAVDPENRSSPQVLQTFRDGLPRRVLRGGCCLNSPVHCRSANRIFFRPDRCNGNMGFRLCCSAEGPCR